MWLKKFAHGGSTEKKGSGRKKKGTRKKKGGAGLAMKMPSTGSRTWNSREQMEEETARENRGEEAG